MGFLDKKPVYDKIKLQTNLKMSVTRLNMQKNKKENLLKAQRKEIALLLKNGKEESARIKVESALRDAYYIEACEILQLFLDLLAARIQLITESKNCPSDMKEAVSTVIWATPRVENVPELLACREQFARKFGKDFAVAASENSEMAVNQKVLGRLSLQVPEPYLCVRYLEEIAQQFEVDWEPSSSTADAAVGIGGTVGALPDPVGGAGAGTPPHIPPMPPMYPPTPPVGGMGGPPPPIMGHVDPHAMPQYGYNPAAMPPPPMVPGPGTANPKEAAPMPPANAPMAPSAPSAPTEGAPHQMPPPGAGAPPASGLDDFADLEARLNALKKN